jgi:hypothetical protein
MAELTAMILSALLLAWPQCRIALMANSHHALRRHATALHMMAAVWWLIPAIRVQWLDTVLPPGDGISHCRYGHIIARLIQTENWAGVQEYLGIGNPAYRVFLGLIYSLFDAPEYIIYLLNGTLAFIGSLWLLDMLLQEFRPAKISIFMVALIAFSPSMLFWTTSNLKEGPMFWGICLTARLFSSSRKSTFEYLEMLVAVPLLLVMRPHIALITVAGYGIGSFVQQGKFRSAFLCGGMIAACVCALPIAAPAVWEKVTSDGLTDALEDGYESRNHIGSSSLGGGGKPIPVVTGLLLIFLRPYPWEVRNITDLSACLEIYIITGTLLVGWRGKGVDFRLLRHPYVISAVCTILMLAFFFSYTYNLGLLVRQRIQLWPAIFVCIAIPYWSARTESAVKLARIGSPTSAGMGLPPINNRRQPVQRRPVKAV